MNQQERELFMALCRFRHPEKKQLSAWSCERCGVG